MKKALHCFISSLKKKKVEPFFLILICYLIYFFITSYVDMFKNNLKAGVLTKKLLVYFISPLHSPYKKITSRKVNKKNYKNTRLFQNLARPCILYCEHS